MITLNRDEVIAVLRLLHYSWKDIDFLYEQLTPQEKECITPLQFMRVASQVRDIESHVQDGIMLEQTSTICQNCSGSGHTYNPRKKDCPVCGGTGRAL